MGYLNLNKRSLVMIFNSNKQYFSCISLTKYSGMNRERERWGFTGDESPQISVILFISIKDVNTTAPKNIYLKSKINTS